MIFILIFIFLQCSIQCSREYRAAARNDAEMAGAINLWQLTSQEKENSTFKTMAKLIQTGNGQNGERLDRADYTTLIQIIKFLDTEWKEEIGSSSRPKQCIQFLWRTDSRHGPFEAWASEQLRNNISLPKRRKAYYQLYSASLYNEWHYFAREKYNGDYFESVVPTLPGVYQLGYVHLQNLFNEYEKAVMAELTWAELKGALEDSHIAEDTQLVVLQMGEGDLAIQKNLSPFVSYLENLIIFDGNDENIYRKIFVPLIKTITDTHENLLPLKRILKEKLMEKYPEKGDLKKAFLASLKKDENLIKEDVKFILAKSRLEKIFCAQLLQKISLLSLLHGIDIHQWLSYDFEKSVADFENQMQQEKEKKEIENKEAQERLIAFNREKEKLEKKRRFIFNLSLCIGGVVFLYALYKLTISKSLFTHF
jgi:hypothetical protein